MMQNLLSTLGAEHDRFHMSPYKRLAATKGKCPFACNGTKYNVKIQRWEHWRSGRSLQISLDDLAIRTEEQHLSCDTTCIIGEFGGNLGFFLGGSLLFGVNVIIECSFQSLEKLYMAWQNRN